MQSQIAHRAPDPWAGKQSSMSGDFHSDPSRALLDVRRMSEADEATVAGTSGIALIKNAGASVAREIARRWSARPLVALCGPGNNGGDGFVVARHLSEAGWPVRLASLCDRERLHGEARHHAQLWTGIIEPLTPAVLDGPQLIVDALFGAGLSRALEGPAKEVLAAAADMRIPSSPSMSRAASWATAATFSERSPRRSP